MSCRRVPCFDADFLFFLCLFRLDCDTPLQKKAKAAKAKATKSKKVLKGKAHEIVYDYMHKVRAFCDIAIVLLFPVTDCCCEALVTLIPFGHLCFSCHPHRSTGESAVQCHRNL